MTLQPSTADTDIPVAWIAADWGTSHLRLWVMGDGGHVLARFHSDRGMGKIGPGDYEGVLLALIGDRLPASGRVPVICCGMAGARQGWAEAGYRAVPCPPATLAGAARPPTADARLSVHILPGLSQAAPADVMRGEETQVAGWLAVHPDFDGVLCLPGTHCKWAHVSAGEVVSFRSFMTGEMFALLSMQSVLRHSMPVTDTADDMTHAAGDAFDTAVADALSRPAAVAGDLFALRAETLLHGLDPMTARARLSGLLIGIELAATRPYWLGRDVAIVGEGGLSDAYARALAAQGVVARRADAQAVTLAGLSAAYLSLGEPAE